MKELQKLDAELLRVIAELISLETFVYLFPEASRRRIQQNPTRYTYTWACNLTHNRIRVRAILMLINLERIPENSFVVDHCSQKGNVYLLQRVFRLVQTHMNINPTSCYSHRSVDWASQYGWVHVLEWWIENCNQLKIPFRYSTHALDYASKYGQMNSLEWWKRQYTRHPNLVLKYTKDAVDFAHSPQVLDWWLDMNLRHDVDLKYSTRCIDRCKDTRILDWWLAAFQTYHLRMKYKNDSIDYASANGETRLLEWWFHRTPLTSIPLKYSEYAIDYASANGHVAILDWWLDQWENHRHIMRYTSAAIDFASENGHLNVLEWWLSKHLEGRVLFKRTAQAINYASRSGHLHILDWWVSVYRRHKMPFLYDAWAIEWALENPETMHWWVEICSRYAFSIEPVNWTRYRALSSRR